MKRNKITMLFAALMLMCSCSDFEEININPNNPPTVPANLLLPTVISTAVSSMTGSGNGAAGQFIQHINYIGGNNESFGRFNITGASFREEWNAPMRSMKDINQMLYIAENNNQSQYKAIGLICKVYVLSLMTDAYGDIPYDEAGKGDISGLEFSHYQNQEDVYGLMLADLETANQLLKTLQADAAISDDILYGGDAVKWRKYANSLKVRILMRQSAKKNVASDIATIFNNPQEYPVFTSIDDQATLVYNNTVDFYKWYIQPRNLPSDGSGVIFGDNFRVSEAIVEALQAKNDPRLPVYVAPTKNSFEANKANPAQPYVYRGQPAGLSAAEQNAIDKDDYSVLSRTIRSESRAFVMTFAELQFLKAEAIVRGMITGDASNEYREGIKASMQKWAVISPADIDAYLMRLDIALSSTPDEALKQIATQAWVDSFLNGFEAFANWRRTGYPVLTVATSVSSPIPVRYIYSDNEQNNPNLISWTNEKLGRMVNETDMVWFQPQKWNTGGETK